MEQSVKNKQIPVKKYHDHQDETYDKEKDFQNLQLYDTPNLKASYSYLIKSDKTYKIPLKSQISAEIRDLDIWVAPGKTLRADYILKFQTQNVLWACSLGFRGVKPETDNFMGTAHWAMTQNGATSTTYSFMTSNPCFYSNNRDGIADSNMPFAGLNDENTFNSVKINIEYYNGSNKRSILSLEFNRDLYRYDSQVVQVIPGSSVEYRVY